MSKQPTPDQADLQVEYRDVPDFPGYRVGTDGSAWSRKLGGRYSKSCRRNWKRLKAGLNSDGYPTVTLYRENSKPVVRTVGAIVLTTFVGPCPAGMECCHNDGDPANNALSNLRWDTHASNIADKKQHGTEHQGEAHYRARLTERAVMEIRRRYASGEIAKVLAAEFAIKKGTVYDIVYRRAWKHVA